MKKFFSLIILSMLLVSCEDAFRSDMAGKWQLRTVEKDGKEVVVDTVWYNFQSEALFMVQVYVPQSDAFVEYNGFMKQENDVLNMVINPYDSWTFIDWTNRERSFTIKKLNGKKMILISEEGYIYSFDKF